MEFSDQASLDEYCVTSGRTFVSVTLAQGDSATVLGSFLLELFIDQCPDTCANFIGLVKGRDGYKYKGTPIHRVVKGGYVQGGDVVDGTGKGKPKFHIPDESFAVKHDEPGILGMANNGDAHTGAAQFYVTLAPLPWLDGKRVAFGKVVTKEGLRLLESLQDLILSNERPVPEVIISDIRVVIEGTAAA